jgi:hypothetical protein
MTFHRTPALLALVLASGIPLQAEAQPSPPPAAKESEEAVEKARQLFADGSKDYQQKQYAKAYVSFVASWALNQHYATAANLADCEIHLGKYRDAAEHLAYAIRLGPKEDAAQRKKLQGALDKMRAHVGTVTLIVDEEGAEVLVDDMVIGKAPLVDPVFANPGRHRIRARGRQSTSKEEVVEVAPGSTHAITLHLETMARSTPASPVSSAGGRLDAPAPLPTTTTEPAGPSPIVIIAGSALTLTGIGLGVGLSAASTSRAGDADDKVDALRQTGGANACSGQPAVCADIDRDRRARDTLATGATVSFVLAGVAAAGTVTYLLVTRNAKTPVGVRVVPAIGMGQGGVGVLGRW